jgi:copper chaperone
MNTISFKTNMKCSGCVEKVTSALDDLVGKDHWEVDLQNADKTLTITGENIQEKKIQYAAEKAGFTIERK